MRLKRLELQGFKSFLDRTVLTFQNGITGVVGPNGCGKSNIVDAIQWVMGEQSAKHLRGESMTDVIFNGSDTKAAASMAEVSLVMDRSGVALPPQFAAFEKAEEISITRRVYRDGNSEYLINKTQCRLRDIHELFMDTGVGRRAYSIIEQGQIDRMISVKPDERRGLFEEVAGITKYKAKRKEAERKLEGTQANLLRLQDIINELEKQIRSLKVQATRARKYKELKSELEAVDLFLLGKNLFQHTNKITEWSSRRDLLVNERSEKDASFGQFEAELTSLEVQKIDQEKQVQSLSERERDLSLAVQRLENQVSLLEERRKHLQASFEGKRLEQSETQARLEELSAEVDAQRIEKDTVEQALNDLEAALSQSEGQISELHRKKTQAIQAKRALEDRRNQLLSRSAHLQNQAQNLEQRKTEQAELSQRLGAKSSELKIQVDNQNQSLLEADQKIEQSTAMIANAENDVTQVHVECQEISKALSSLEEELYDTREQFHAKNSRLQSLEELATNLEGYAQSARDILLQLGDSGISAIPLAECLTPEAAIEDHLETLLGWDMSTLLVRTTEEAEKLTRQVSDQGLERIRVVAVEELGGSPLETAAIPAGTVDILSRVKVKEGFEAAAQWWLGNVRLTQDLSQLFDLRKNYPGQSFLSPDGLTLSSADHSISAGKVPTKTGVFARRREIEELKVECQALESELSRITTERENRLQYLQGQEKLHSELKDKLSSIHIEAVGFRKEREKLQFELTRLEREFTSLENDIERSRQQLASLESQANQVQVDLASVTEESSRVESEFAGSGTEIEAAERALDEVVRVINEKKIERSSLAERRNSVEYKLDKLEEETKDATERLETLKDQELEDQAELVKIDTSVVEVKTQGENSVVERNQVLVQLADVKQAFNETCTALNELRAKKEELQKQRELISSEVQELEIKMAHEQASLEQLRGISNERYHCDPTPLDESVQMDLEKLPLFVEQLSVDWSGLSDHDRKNLLEEHLKNVRDKVGRYGEVNLTAIQEFDEIQKRYDFLVEQKADLENSIKILQDAILKIDETTKTRFTETFEAVNKKFVEIFPILFNGGKAELTLVHTEGQLDPGVDILAQPPGKRLQSITLLSGGEKALTAVSLVLAIFARKPSPFCLLDEVDAPLDDANVSRFNTVVKKMAEKTQFIVVTHNKKTMEIAEALYGVTMQRNGISKMASVSLQ